MSDRTYNGMLLVFIVAVIGVVAAWEWPAVSDNQVLSVKRGMTEVEVIQIMGEPDNKGGYGPWVWSRGRGRVAVVEFSADRRVDQAFND